MVMGCCCFYPVSLSARSFLVTPACPVQCIHKGFPKWMSIVLAHASLGFPFHFSPVVASSLNLLVMSSVTANHEMESEAGVCKNWRACRDNAVPTYLISSLAFDLGYLGDLTS